MHGRILRVLAAAAVVAWWAVLPLAPSSAAPTRTASSVTGCSGTLTSYDADGKRIDAAKAADGQVIDLMGGGQAFTRSNPFLVDNEGIVKYSGTTEKVITDHHWAVSMLGIEVVTGGSANAGRLTDTSGTFDFAAKVPLGFTGLVRVSGDLSGTGGSCSGDGYVKVQGNPFTSPVTWGGIAFAGVGALILFFSLPKVAMAKGVA